jgi:hypothetical protein
MEVVDGGGFLTALLRIMKRKRLHRGSIENAESSDLFRSQRPVFIGD